MLNEQVGDFGLSRLKLETFLTTKIGKGTVGSSCFFLLVTVIYCICLKHFTDSCIIFLCTLNGWHQKFFVMNPFMRSMFNLCSQLLFLSSFLNKFQTSNICICYFLGTYYISPYYGFGVILWEIVTEKIPWDNLNSMQLLLSCVDKPLKIYSCATSNDSKA